MMDVIYLIQNNSLIQLANEKKIKIGVVGLGYVGLPVSIIFSKKYEVVGYDM